VSDCALAAASFGSSAACDGAAKNTNKPAATTNAERPLALIFILAISPLLVPETGMRPHGVSAAGQKKGIFGRSGGKLGIAEVPGGRVGQSPFFCLTAADACGADRCYGPFQTHWPS
jgi:hypothetical protein